MPGDRPTQFEDWKTQFSGRQPIPPRYVEQLVFRYPSQEDKKVLAAEPFNYNAAGPATELNLIADSLMHMGESRPLGFCALVGVGRDPRFVSSELTTIERTPVVGWMQHRVLACRTAEPDIDDAPMQPARPDHDEPLHEGLLSQLDFAITRITEIRDGVPRDFSERRAIIGANIVAESIQCGARILYGLHNQSQGQPPQTTEPQRLGPSGPRGYL